MPEGWDGITKDLDEVHYEISQKEDEMLYQEFVQRMNFNKKKVSCSPHNLVFLHIHENDMMLLLKHTLLLVLYYLSFCWSEISVVERSRHRLILVFVE